MAIGIFLRLDGVTGEATDKLHAGWIEVHSYSWGVQEPYDPATGQATGRTVVSALSLVLPSTTAAPQLISYAVANRVVKTATLDVMHPLKGKGTGVVGRLHRFALTAPRIVSYSLGGSVSDVTPLDHAAMVFADVVLTTTTANASQTRTVTVTWAPPS